MTLHPRRSMVPRAIRAVALPSLLLLSFGCATTQVETVEHRGADWDRYRTYTLSMAPEESLGQSIHTEIGKQLDARGLRAAGDEADLYVSFEVTGEQRTRRRNSADPDANFYVTEQYIEKHLRIEIRETRAGDLLWSAVGRTEVSDPDRIDALASQAVREIFLRFPRNVALARRYR